MAIVTREDRFYKTLADLAVIAEQYNLTIGELQHLRTHDGRIERLTVRIARIYARA